MGIRSNQKAKQMRGKAGDVWRMKRSSREGEMKRSSRPAHVSFVRRETTSQPKDVVTICLPVARRATLGCRGCYSSSARVSQNNRSNPNGLAYAWTCADVREVTSQILIGDKRTSERVMQDTRTVTTIVILLNEFAIAWCLTRANSRAVTRRRRCKLCCRQERVIIIDLSRTSFHSARASYPGGWN
jgi:hypothetical protein